LSEKVLIRRFNLLPPENGADTLELEAVREALTAIYAADKTLCQ